MIKNRDQLLVLVNFIRTVKPVMNFKTACLVESICECVIKGTADCGLIDSQMKKVLYRTVDGMNITTFSVPNIQEIFKVMSELSPEPLEYSYRYFVESIDRPKE
jgi:hypothetical protein